MTKTAAFVTFCLTLLSCSTVIVPEATGGSSSQGIIEFTYTQKTSVRANINWDQVQEQAVARCASWDFQGAQNTDDASRVCIDRSSSSGLIPTIRVGAGRQQSQTIGLPTIAACREYKHTVTYQCTGGGN